MSECFNTTVFYISHVAFGSKILKGITDFASKLPKVVTVF